MPKTARSSARTMYEGELGDLFTLQDRISASVVGTIAPHVLEQELVRARRKHPQNMTAYDFLLQALDQLYKMDDKSHARARGLLQQAMAYDPFYGLAYSYTAFWYIFHVGEGRSTAQEADNREAARLPRSRSGRMERSVGIGNLRPCAVLFAARLRSGDAVPGPRDRGRTKRRHRMDHEQRNLWLHRQWTAGGRAGCAWGPAGSAGRVSVLARSGARPGTLCHGDYDEAAVWARRAVGRNRAMAFSLRLLTASLVALGKTDEAVITVGTCFSCRPASV